MSTSDGKQTIHGSRKSSKRSPIRRRMRKVRSPLRHRVDQASSMSSIWTAARDSPAWWPWEWNRNLRRHISVWTRLIPAAQALWKKSGLGGRVYCNKKVSPHMSLLVLTRMQNAYRKKYRWSRRSWGPRANSRIISSPRPIQNAEGSCAVACQNHAKNLPTRQLRKTQ